MCVLFFVCSFVFLCFVSLFCFFVLFLCCVSLLCFFVFCFVFFCCVSCVFSALLTSPPLLRKIYHTITQLITSSHNNKLAAYRGLVVGLVDCCRLVIFGCNDALVVGCGRATLFGCTRAVGGCARALFDGCRRSLLILTALPVASIPVVPSDWVDIFPVIPPIRDDFWWPTLALRFAPASVCLTTLPWRCMMSLCVCHVLFFCVWFEHLRKVLLYF